MSRNEVIEKARDLTLPILGREKSQRLIETVVSDRIRNGRSQFAAAPPACLSFFSSTVTVRVPIRSLQKIQNIRTT
jgi:hypothetical protein